MRKTLIQRLKENNTASDIVRRTIVSTVGGLTVFGLAFGLTEETGFDYSALTAAKYGVSRTTSQRLVA